MVKKKKLSRVSTSDRVRPPTQRGRSFFKKNYALSWDYVKETKNFIYASLGLFFLFVFAGAFLPISPEIEKALIELINKLILTTEGMSSSELIAFILLNNVQSSFLGVLYGTVFGIFPVVSGIVNGYLLGFVVSKSVESEGIFILWRLFPHGIFELPALFLSLGMGLKLGSFVFQKDKLKSLKEYLINSLRVFVLVIIPLLIIAAVIEGSLISIGS
ncbi:MAG: stage II sporulation protein M [Nanoarchaeota archaeon]|nr:stage II sporulation protein M [Nanoarchaeota archaeon]MBU1501252.1 stage II sporulation protein M [Nanoarchaeota archaeon]MBU2459472.1 stage II sporulation protein M [Nanoarchaeota archaeon]